MNTAETTALLRVRRDLTGETFNDGTVTAWRDALADWQLPAVRTALVAAAREHQRVTVAHVTERLPRRSTAPVAPPPDPRPCGCPPIIRDDQGHPLLCQHEIANGLAGIARIRAQLATPRTEQT